MVNIYTATLHICVATIILLLRRMARTGGCVKNGYNSAKQLCCFGKVLDKIVTDAACCGTSKNITQYNTKTQICCGGRSSAIHSTTVAVAVSTIVDTNTNAVLINYRLAEISCCAHTAYYESDYNCCYNKLIKQGWEKVHLLLQTAIRLFYPHVLYWRYPDEEQI